MRVLRWLGIGLGVVVLAIGGLFVGARFADGPVAIIPGGTLRSGDWVAEPVADWSFARDLETIELQLEAQSTSRTVWILVVDGDAYIPASLVFPPGKTWHYDAANDGRAIVRIDGRRYRVQLAKDDTGARFDALASEVARKYTAAPGTEETDPQVWFFRVTSRAG